MTFLHQKVTRSHRCEIIMFHKITFLTTIQQEIVIV